MNRDMWGKPKVVNRNQPNETQQRIERAKAEVKAEKSKAPAVIALVVVGAGIAVLVGRNTIWSEETQYRSAP